MRSVDIVFTVVMEKGCVRVDEIDILPRPTTFRALEKLVDMGVLEKYNFGHVVFYCNGSAPDLLDRTLKALCDIYSKRKTKGGLITIRIREIAEHMGIVWEKKSRPNKPVHVSAIRYILLMMPGIYLLTKGKVIFFRHALEELCEG